MFEPILAALTGGGVRFVVVGGVAAVLHGHPRFTADLDIALDLTADNPARAIDTLTDLGLVPSLPIPARDFADPELRAEWVGTRHLMVFTFVDKDDPFRRVDLFAEDPIPWDELWSRSQTVSLGTLTVQIASVDDLIAMKKRAGRTQDLADVEALERIRDRQL